MKEREKQIILHIGPPKTGSSSLQHNLYVNKSNLMQSHILYPEAGILAANKKVKLKRGNGIIRTESGPDDSHQYLAWSLTRRIDEDYRGIVADMLAEIEKKNPNKIVISAEAFYHFDEHEILKLKELLKAFKVTIVCYLRHPYRRALSSYNQLIKRGKYKKSFSAYIRTTYLEALERQKKIFQLWALIFGKENFIIRPFDQLISKKMLVKDFFEIIGIDDTSNEKIVLEESQKNPSINSTTIAIIRGVNNLQPRYNGKPLFQPAFNLLRALLRRPILERTLISWIRKLQIPTIGNQEDYEFLNTAIADWYPGFLEDYINAEDMDYFIFR